MEEFNDSSLSCMKHLARLVEEGLRKLHNSVSCVEGMVSHVENTPQAEAEMSAILSASIQLHEIILELDQQFTESSESIKKTNETVSGTIAQWTDSLDQFDDMLGKFGYVPYQPPTEESAVEEQLSNNFENLDLSSESEGESAEVSDAFQEDCSLVEGEITPFILGRKLQSFNKSSGKSTNTLAVNGEQEYSTHSAPCVSKKFVFNASPFLEPSIREQTSSSVPKLRKLPEKPKMPVLSKLTYEVLGKTPPPECDESII